LTRWQIHHLSPFVTRLYLEGIAVMDSDESGAIASCCRRQRKDFLFRLLHSCHLFRLSPSCHAPSGHENGLGFRVQSLTVEGVGLVSWDMKTDHKLRPTHCIMNHELSLQDSITTDVPSDTNSRPSPQTPTPVNLSRQATLLSPFGPMICNSSPSPLNTCTSNRS